MTLYIDLDTRAFIETPQFPRSLVSIDLKRGDANQISVAFLRNGIVQELPDGTTGKFGIKVRDRYASNSFLAFAGSWNKSGTGEGARYAFDLNLDTAEVSAEFISSPASINAMAEVEWETGGLRTSSSTLAVVIQNDVIRGLEGIPTTATPFVRTGGDGTLQFFNSTTGAWHSLSVVGAAGQETLEISAALAP